MPVRLTWWEPARPLRKQAVKPRQPNEQVWVKLLASVHCIKIVTAGPCDSAVQQEGQAKQEPSIQPSSAS
jgi:hypothetical protein